MVVEADLQAPLKYPMVRPSTAPILPLHRATADCFEVRLCAVHGPREV
ncbi:hypothetical protein [Streptomyces sp. NPDC051704]